MAFSVLRQFQGRRLDAARLVDLLGHLEGRFQFGAAVVLHELVALGLLFGFGLRQRQVQAGRHGTEQHFHALGKDDALGELARFFARREHQRFLRGREFAEACNLLDLIGRHRQADPPLNHVEHGLRGTRQIVDILCSQPEPGP